MRTAERPQQVGRAVGLVDDLPAHGAPHGAGRRCQPERVAEVGGEPAPLGGAAAPTRRGRRTSPSCAPARRAPGSRPHRRRRSPAASTCAASGPRANGASGRGAPSGANRSARHRARTPTTRAGRGGRSGPPNRYSRRPAPWPKGNVPARPPSVRSRRARRRRFAAGCPGVGAAHSANEQGDHSRDLGHVVERGRVQPDDVGDVRRKGADPAGRRVLAARATSIAGARG